MRKNIIISISILFFMCLVFSTVSAADPVSYWSFDDENGPAKDVTGDNDGVVNGAISVFDGQFGTAALSFDGLDDTVEITDSADFHFGSDPFTIAFFMRLHYVSGALGIMDQYQDDDNIMQIYTNKKEIEFAHWSYGYLARYATVGVNLVPDVWYHVVFVSDMTTSTFYIDGIQAGLNILKSQRGFSGSGRTFDFWKSIYNQ